MSDSKNGEKFKILSFKFFMEEEEGRGKLFKQSKFLQDSSLKFFRRGARAGWRGPCSKTNCFKFQDSSLKFFNEEGGGRTFQKNNCFKIQVSRFKFKVFQ